jgi:hypothetical protein
MKVLKLNKFSIAKSFKIFIKNMTHHLNGQMVGFAKNWSNIILTRSPKSLLLLFLR